MTEKHLRVGFIGMGIGGFQGGYFFDISGNYATSFANAAYAGIANLAILFFLMFYQARRKAIPNVPAPQA